MDDRTSSGELLRVLGPVFTVAVGLGTVIGGGILRTPATVLDAIPNTEVALILWVAVGVHSLIQANVIAEVMTLWARSGGLMVPAEEAFGEPAALLVGWADWLSNVAAIAALALLTADFAAMLVPVLATAKMSVAAATLFALTLLNGLGVREGGHSQIVGSALKTVFLLGVVGAIFLFVPPAAARVTPAAPPAAPLGWAALFIAYQTIIGAYSGWANSSYFGAENVDPGANVPRGLFVTIISSGSLFLLVTVALNHAMPLGELRRSTLPIADALRPLLGASAVKLVAMGAALIVLTCCNSNLMVGPRILYALGEARLLPAASCRVNRGGTPIVALLITSLCSLGLILTGSFETVFVIMAALSAIPLLAGEVSLFKLRRDRRSIRRPWRAIAYPWLPLLAILLDSALLVGFVVADPQSGLFAVGAVVIAIPIGVIMRRRNKLVRV